MTMSTREVTDYWMLCFLFYRFIFSFFIFSFLVCVLTPCIVTWSCSAFALIPNILYTIFAYTTLILSLWWWWWWWWWWPWTSVPGVWHLSGTEALRKEVVYSLRPGVAYPRLYFSLHLQRKPHYYLITITLPCIFLTFIALLVCNVVMLPYQKL